MLAGGSDDLFEESSYGVANMKATSNAEAELAMGRELTEMSRLARLQLLARASWSSTLQSVVLLSALLPRRAYILCLFSVPLLIYSETSDQAGHSTPAPERTVPGIACEASSKNLVPILDLEYRRRQLDFCCKQISQRLYQ